MAGKPDTHIVNDRMLLRMDKSVTVANLAGTKIAKNVRERKVLNFRACKSQHPINE